MTYKWIEYELDGCDPDVVNLELEGVDHRNIKVRLAYRTLANGKMQYLTEIDNLVVMGTRQTRVWKDCGPDTLERAKEWAIRQIDPPAPLNPRKPTFNQRIKGLTLAQLELELDLLKGHPDPRAAVKVKALRKEISRRG